MQSSDDGDLRVTPDLLHQLVQVADVMNLGRSAQDAWTGDTELARSMGGEFGTVTIPIVKDGEVVFGWDAVEAEQIEQRDGGRLMVVDISGLDWPKERVWALVAGLHRQRERVSVDQVVLADLLLDIQRTSAEWLTAAGWGETDLTDLLAAVQAPSLEALEKEHGVLGDGDGDGSAFWPWIRVQVEPSTFKRWEAVIEEAPGRNDSERIEWVLEQCDPDL